MRRIFITFLFLFMLSGVMAIGFSPSSLIFELEPGVKNCGIISVSSDSSAIGVDDKWASDVDVEWNVGLFDTEASDHGISINYDDELLADEREVEVCLSGEEVGEYHGVIVLREEQEGSSIVQMGIWIKLTIKQTNNNTGNLSDNDEVIEVREDVIETGDDVVGSGEKDNVKKTLFTGGVVGVALEHKSAIALGFVVVLGCFGLMIYRFKKRKENLMSYGFH